MEAEPRNPYETADLFELKTAILYGSRQLINDRLDSALYEFYGLTQRPPKAPSLWQRAVEKITR
jgi:hypothetical protein